MIAKRIQGKGILAKLLEKGIRILLIKECKNIRNIKIDIISSSNQIIKGEIQKINIIAEDINFKNLLFDKVELKAIHIKINFNMMSKKLCFKNDPLIKFKISLSQNSLEKVLLSNDWNYIGNIICKEILSQVKLENIKIKNNQLIIKSNNENSTIKDEEQIEIKTDKGKIYFKNNNNNKTIIVPIEEKIYIENVNIENNLINIFGNSSISF